jgi:hypothetical protein
MARTASSPRASLGSDTRPPRDRYTRGAWRRPESDPCVDGRSPRRKYRRRRVMSGTPPTSVARMWRRPFRVIRDIAGPDLASMGDESTRAGGPLRWRRAVLRAARPIAVDLQPRAETKRRASVLSLPSSGHSTVFCRENQLRVQNLPMRPSHDASALLGGRSGGKFGGGGSEGTLIIGSFRNLKIPLICRPSSNPSFHWASSISPIFEPGDSSIGPPEIRHSSHRNPGTGYDGHAAARRMPRCATIRTGSMVEAVGSATRRKPR